MKKIISQIKFTISNQPKYLLFVVITMVTLIFIVFNSQGKDGLQWWSNWIDPVVGVFTFLAAFSVWLSNQKQHWEDDLEKRLTISFEYNNHEIMRCEEVYLAGEGDIRTWGQQVGKQMANNTHLEFEPFLEEGKEDILFDTTKNIYFKLYRATIFLTKKPAHIGLRKGENNYEHYKYTEEIIETNDQGIACVVWRRKKAISKVLLS